MLLFPLSIFAKNGNFVKLSCSCKPAPTCWLKLERWLQCCNVVTWKCKGNASGYVNLWARAEGIFCRHWVQQDHVTFSECEWPANAGDHDSGQVCEM